MIDTSHKEQCCGCTACATVCAHGAITMHSDALGFQYPTIDESKCVACGLCEKACAFQNGYDTSTNLDTPLVYAARNKDIDELLTSRSGGVFPELAKQILAQRGAVYGVAVDAEFNVLHQRATTIEACFAFKGSKYVQSYLGTTFSDVKKDLQNGLPVLFSGTPCQTAGLRASIPKALQSNLLVCDIICHGVPSPAVWKGCLDYIENKHQKKISKVDFRDKTKSWKKHYESFLFQDNTKVKSEVYTDLFYKHIMLRPSCGVCKYTNFNRPSDLTLGDYWGWENLAPSFNKDDKGCSLVLVNTPKGKDYFDAIAPQFHLIVSSPDRCLQHNLQQPTKLSDKSCIFEKDFTTHGYQYVTKKYGSTTHLHKLARFIYLAITFPHRRVKKMIKKVR